MSTNSFGKKRFIKYKIRGKRKRGGNGGRGKEKERRKEEDLLKYKSVSIQHETGDKVNQESSTVQWHSSYILY